MKQKEIKVWMVAPGEHPKGHGGSNTFESGLVLDRNVAVLCVYLYGVDTCA